LSRLDGDIVALVTKSGGDGFRVVFRFGVGRRRAQLRKVLTAQEVGLAGPELAQFIADDIVGQVNEFRRQNND